MDIFFLRSLSMKANVIPVIAKADAMTPEEMLVFKSKVVFNKHDR
jgi:septin family protein